MRKRLLLLLPVLAAGCSQRSDVEAALKAHMRDPDSARFERVLMTKKGDKACAVWNARNGFGGYGEWTASELVNTEGGWRVREMDIPPSRCTEEAYRAWDEYEQASEGLANAISNASPETLKALSDAERRVQQQQEADQDSQDGRRRQ